jgi:tetratricopeptide (TPR) repeat protein
MAPVRAAGGSDEAAKDPREAQARSYFNIGLSHFTLGELDEAIEAFQAGYRCKPLPLFLFNVAQAARKGGKVEMAIDYYRQYLEHEPSRTPQRIEAEEQLVRLRRQRATAPPVAKPASPTAPAASPTVQPTLASPKAAPAPAVRYAPSLAVATAPAPAPRPSWWKRGWFWGTVVSVVVVGAGVGVGTWFGLQSRTPERPSLGSITF